MIKVLFKEPTDLIGRIILKITGGSYSHCEILIDGDVYSADERGVYCELCADTTYLSRFTELDLTHCIEKYSLDIDAAAQFLNKQVGKKYDWLNMFFSKLFPFNADKKNRWICSELVTAALQKARLPVTNRPKDVTPRRLYDVLMEWFAKDNGQQPVKER